jgi:hypothetical protein
MRPKWWNIVLGSYRAYVPLHGFPLNCEEVLRGFWGRMEDGPGKGAALLQISGFIPRFGDEDVESD